MGKHVIFKGIYLSVKKQSKNVGKVFAPLYISHLYGLQCNHQIVETAGKKVLCKQMNIYTNNKVK